ARLLPRRPTGRCARRAPRGPWPADSCALPPSLVYHLRLQNRGTHPLPRINAPSSLNRPTPQRPVPLRHLHSIHIAPLWARGLVQSIFSAAVARCFAVDCETLSAATAALKILCNMCCSTYALYRSATEGKAATH